MKYLQEKIFLNFYFECVKKFSQSVPVPKMEVFGHSPPESRNNAVVRNWRTRQFGACRAATMPADDVGRCCAKLNETASTTPNVQRSRSPHAALPNQGRLAKVNKWDFFQIFRSIYACRLLGRLHVAKATERIGTLWCFVYKISVCVTLVWVLIH